MTDNFAEFITKEVQTHGYSPSLLDEITKAKDAIAMIHSKIGSGGPYDKEILCTMIEAYARIRAAQIGKA